MQGDIKLFILKKLLVLVIISSITACVAPTVTLPQEVVEIGNPYDDVLYIGDSLCVSTRGTGGSTAQEQVGIGRDCKSGRNLIEYGNLPTGFTTIFLALGTNDVGRTPLDTYRADLQLKLLNTDSRVVCVLPTQNINGVDSAPYRNTLLEECQHTIDPTVYHVEQGFTEDGYHWGVIAHNNFTQAIIDNL